MVVVARTTIASPILRITFSACGLTRKVEVGQARYKQMWLYARSNVEARLPDLRAALTEESDGLLQAGASAFDGLVVARLVSATPSRLRHALIASILALGGRSTPRLWR